ncbi:TPA: energy-coupling factor transporter transmembrane protein EcfT [Streptococcus equi subsp. zooepidemicus]|nr:energy-coupling factor transporter transmembrane protein EcfT [Streptococcus equi subsp. zooepidemicus]HEO6656936.1 energy-coupling factor transporter transmembrane protein EcfT [Streptococcus agalactiae]HEL0317804.1 energy-coupling factor transporter transmembrane protein EcfT [Streptococcus equi subsp. zooepidemicus]HEL0331657.1 energy-coupling factor transporter transmembrane protein EcfT [Streptococcus equi subsp. zooepidemicus]HEL0335630.1 energy-coupling factor transporter transmembran
MNDVRTIDPRIKLTLLPVIGFISFFISDTILLFVILLFSFLLYIYSGIYKKAFSFLVFFSLLLGLEYGMAKISDYNFVFALYMMIYFLSRMTLIAMFGAYITRTTKISEMIEALNRMKIPRSISIPFSVLLRFAPTMRHEVKALKENMRIRGVIKNKFFILLHPIRYVEYTLVPLLMRMMKVSDELSASALIRGLDSEERRVTIIELKFKLMDLITIVIGFLAIVSVVIVQKTNLGG